MARTGGVKVPKQLQQFETVAVNYGADGKPDTKDDLNLGAGGRRVGPSTSTPRRSETTISSSWAKSTRAVCSSRTSMGQIRSDRVIGTTLAMCGWSRAYTPEGSTKPLRARAHLLVTVPVYLNWEPKQIGLGR